MDQISNQPRKRTPTGQLVDMFSAYVTLRDDHTVRMTLTRHPGGRVGANVPTVAYEGEWYGHTEPAAVLALRALADGLELVLQDRDE